MKENQASCWHNSTASTSMPKVTNNLLNMRCKEDIIYSFLLRNNTKKVMYSEVNYIQLLFAQ